MSLQSYKLMEKMGEGTFSDVFKCQCLLDGKLYACKRMKKKYHSLEQVSNLREVQALKRLNPHPHIIEMMEVVFDKKKGTMALIFELMDMNIYELIKDRKTYLSEQKVKMYMYQLCKSIFHMHRNGIFHRDVKPENILIKGTVLKLADFGTCKSVYSKQPYTEYISTRWYRAPECLLTDGHYTYKMDMWSLGCVMYEVMSLRPLFPGSNELDQVAKIHSIVGTPSQETLRKLKKFQSRHMEFNFPYTSGSGIAPLLKHASSGCVDLVSRLCTYDPDYRLNARQALKHPYFKDLRDAERRARQMAASPSIVSDVQSARLLATGNVQPHHHHSHHLTKKHKHYRHRQQPGQLLPDLPQGLEVSHESHPLKHSHHIPPSLKTGLAEEGLLPHIGVKQYGTKQYGTFSGATSGAPSVLPSHKSTSYGHFLPQIFSGSEPTKAAQHLTTLTKPARTGPGFPG